jgi:hypothetical protein
LPVRARGGSGRRASPARSRTDVPMSSYRVTTTRARRSSRACQSCANRAPECPFMTLREPTSLRAE